LPKQRPHSSQTEGRTAWFNTAINL
jgi:hypothetical protein